MKCSWRILRYSRRVEEDGSRSLCGRDLREFGRLALHSRLGDCIRSETWMHISAAGCREIELSVSLYAVEVVLHVLSATRQETIVLERVGLDSASELRMDVERKRLGCRHRGGAFQTVFVSTEDVESFGSMLGDVVERRQTSKQPPGKSSATRSREEIIEEFLLLLEHDVVEE